MTQTDINVPVDGTITSAKLSGDLVTPGALDVTGTVTADGLTIDGAATIDGGATDNTVLTLDSGTANTYLKITDSNSTNGTFIGATTNDLNFYPNNSLAATMTASGNLLVGTTATDTAAVGFRYRSSLDAISSVADGGISAYFGRRTSDGDIVAFRKNDDILGSIGGTGTNSYIDSQGGTFKISTVGTVRYNFDEDQIYPSVDNDASLGFSTFRFKDLFLSGGAYLGGTAAVNKLDDYEEGTWNPVATNINASGYSVEVAEYTKIGRLVSCDLRVRWTGSANTSGSINFSLPFPSQNTTGASRTGIVFYQGTQIFSGAAISTHIPNNTSIVGFYKTDGGTFQAVASNQVNGSYDWLVSFSYFTA
jgi:hypothetical protein